MLQTGRRLQCFFTSGDRESATSHRERTRGSADTEGKPLPISKHIASNRTALRRIAQPGTRAALPAQPLSNGRVSSPRHPAVECPARFLAFRTNQQQSLSTVSWKFAFQCADK